MLLLVPPAVQPAGRWCRSAQPHPPPFISRLAPLPPSLPFRPCRQQFKARREAAAAAAAAEAAAVVGTAREAAAAREAAIMAARAANYSE